jgi:hypothetical protein
MTVDVGVGPGWVGPLAITAALLLAGCTPKPRHDAPVPLPASVSASAAAPSVTPRAPTPSADLRAGLVAGVVARERAVKALFGPSTRTQVVDGTFVLAQPGGSSALFDGAAALLQRALPAFFDGRFTTRPREGVTVLLFPTHDGYAAYCRAHGEAGEQDSFGVYRKRAREIVADGSGGAAYLPTLTHEMVHALVDTDF